MPAHSSARVALVTGVSRRVGIGFAVAKRLLADGMRVFATGWEAHDAEMPWGADPGGVPALIEELGDPDRLKYAAADLALPAGALGMAGPAPAALSAAADLPLCDRLPPPLPDAGRPAAFRQPAPICTAAECIAGGQLSPEPARDDDDDDHPDNHRGGDPFDGVCRGAFHDEKLLHALGGRALPFG